MTPAGEPDEQTEAERLEIARRYRARRRDELLELARPHTNGEPLAAGEFSTLPLESLAAIPIIGALFAILVRLRGSRRRLTPNVIVAVDADTVHLLGTRKGIEGVEVSPLDSWPRTAVSVRSVRPAFMRERVTLELPEGAEQVLYATPLRTNPWSAAVIRELGGEAPEPMDLGE